MIARAEPPPDFWTIPPGAIAFWAYDPGATAGATRDRNRELVEAALAWAIPASAGAGLSPLLETIRDSVAIGASPYRLVLLKCIATSPPPVRGDPKPAAIEQIETVLVTDHPADVARLIAGLRTRAEKGATETDLPLPGDRKGHILAPKGDNTAIEWCEDRGSLTVGVGAGSLSHWYSLARPSDNDPAPLHATALPHTGRPALIGWVSLNALRESSPELFAYGRYARLLHAWELSNSRSLYLSGRVAPSTDGAHPPLLALSAAWSPRSEPTTSIHTAALSEAAWPEGVPVTAPTDCSYAMVLNADWRALFNGLLGAAEALAPSPTAFQNQYKHWSSDHASALVRTVNALGDHAVIYGPTPTGHTTAAVLFAKPDASSFTASATSLSAALSPAVIRNGITGGFRLKPDQQPAPPWSGLQWSLDPRTQRIDFSWTTPPP